MAGPSLEQYGRPSRAERVTPVRTFLDHGIAVSLGSDSPVVPFPPLRVLYHVTTRDTITGGVFGPDERISREEALRGSDPGERLAHLRGRSQGLADRRQAGRSRRALA